MINRGSVYGHASIPLPPLLPRRPRLPTQCTPIIEELVKRFSWLESNNRIMIMYLPRQPHVCCLYVLWDAGMFYHCYIHKNSHAKLKLFSYLRKYLFIPPVISRLKLWKASQHESFRIQSDLAHYIMRANKEKYISFRVYSDPLSRPILQFST